MSRILKTLNTYAKKKEKEKKNETNVDKSMEWLVNATVSLSIYACGFVISVSNTYKCTALDLFMLNAIIFNSND